MTDEPRTPKTDEPDRAEPAHPVDDDGAALRRAAESIKEAESAEDTVAAHDDITTLDDQRAGIASEDPDGAGGS